MSDNPFEAPVAVPSAARAVGSLSVYDAFAHGWRSMTQHFGSWLVMFLVGGTIGLFSVLLILPALFVLPPLILGGFKFTLAALEDEPPHWRLILEPFRDYGHFFGRGLSLGLVTTVPGILMTLPVRLIFLFDPSSLILLGVGTVLGGVFQLVWVFLLFPRLSLAAYFVVESDMTGFEAVAASWDATREQKVNMFLLALGQNALLTAGFFIPPLLGLFPAAMIASAANASAYRQLAQPRPGLEATRA